MRNKKLVLSIIFLLVLAFFLSSCATTTPVVIKQDYDFSQIKRVAVLDFADVAYFRDLGPMVSQLFVKYLLNTQYNVVERAELDAILREHNLSVAGILNPEQRKEFGRISGVDAIITGSVTRAYPEKIIYDTDGTIRYTSAEVGVTCRMISIETGEILWVASDTYDAIDIQTAFEYLASFLMKELTSLISKN